MHCNGCLSEYPHSHPPLFVSSHSHKKPMIAWRPIKTTYKWSTDYNQYAGCGQRSNLFILQSREVRPVSVTWPYSPIADQSEHNRFWWLLYRRLGGAKIAQSVKNLGSQSIDRRFGPYCRQGVFSDMGLYQNPHSKLLAWLRNTMVKIMEVTASGKLRSKSLYTC